MAKVSIIVPVYNTEKYLGKCIDSLLAQTLDDIEIILIDDCSKDKSFDIMRTYQQANPRQIKIIRCETNGGAAKARNIGLDIATGEYIGFIDSDDYITPQMYEEMFIACEDTQSDMARTDRKIVYKGIDLSFLGRNCSYETYSIINPREDTRYLVTEPPSCTNKLFRRDFINNAKFPEKIKWEDYPFSVPLMVSANQIVTIPGKNYSYNLHLSSTTCSDARKLNRNLLDIFTCSDMVGNSCITEDSNANVRYLINYVQMYNCVQRLKEIVNAAIPLQEKRELLTLVSSLIKVKYGQWQEHELHQEQKANSFIHGLRIGITERLLLPDDDLPKSEEILKQKIKVKLDQNTK